VRLEDCGKHATMFVVALRLGGAQLATVVALGALAIPWYFVVRTLREARPVVAARIAPTGVVWGGRVFVARGPLHHWLHFRGVAYSVWAYRHPAAASVLASR
jgi:hypothetical protein